MNRKFNRKSSKKGAIEMSINLIIMLVIGLTILGLIISFVTGFLTEAKNKVGGQLTEDDKTKLQQVEGEPGNFAFLSGTVVVKKNAKKGSKLYMKIRNPGTAAYEADFSADNGLMSASSITELAVEISKGKGAGDIFPDIYGPTISLDAGATGSFPLEVFAGNEVSPGTYYAKFTAVIDGNPTSKIITIEVE